MASVEQSVSPGTHGVLQTLSGSRTATSGYSPGDTSGQPALWSSPHGILVDKENEVLYVADSNNHVVRKVSLVDPSNVYLVAGQPESSGCADGQREEATFYEPRGLALDHEGNLYVADFSNHLIRKVSTPQSACQFCISFDQEAGVIKGKLHCKIISSDMKDFFPKNPMVKVRGPNTNGKTVKQTVENGRKISGDDAARPA